MSEQRVTRIHIVPEGQPIFSGQAFSVEIDDDAGGEFLVIQCNDDQCANGQIRLDPAEWPSLRDAIERMVKECKG